jgi:hypothetical protein
MLLLLLLLFGTHPAEVYSPLFQSFLSNILNSYASEQLKRHSLLRRRHHFNTLFLIQVYPDSKIYPFLLETAGLRVSTRCIRDCSLFNVCSSNKNCPSAIAFQLLMLFVGTLMYSYLEPKLFLLIIFIMVLP